MKQSLVFLVCVFLITSCATSPTGRQQLVLMPDNQMNSLGVQSFTQMKSEVPVETDAKANTYVKCIANAIIKANADKLNERSWEIVVFRSKDVNAFALPGGKIGVYTGILPVAKTPSQLAAVLGHEVGHVLARHGNERVSEGLATQGIMLAADQAFKNSNNRSLIMAGLGLGAQFGVLLPHSRAHESEADLIGLEFMARAGFDPQQSVALWQNMGQVGGGSQPPEWMSTHPAHGTRIRDLQSKIPSVMGLYNASKDSGPAKNCGVL